MHAIYWMIPENIHTYTTDSFLEFRAQGAWGSGESLACKSKGMGVLMIGIPSAWERFSRGNRQEDKSVRAQMN